MDIKALMRQRIKYRNVLNENIHRRIQDKSWEKYRY